MYHCTFVNWLKTDSARLITGTEMLSGHGFVRKYDNISLWLFTSLEIAILINPINQFT